MWHGCRKASAGARDGCRNCCRGIYPIEVDRTVTPHGRLRCHSTATSPPLIMLCLQRRTFHVATCCCLMEWKYEMVVWLDMLLSCIDRLCTRSICCKMAFYYVNLWE